MDTIETEDIERWGLPGATRARFLERISAVRARYQAHIRLHIIQPATTLGGMVDGEPAYRYLAGVRDLVQRDLLQQSAVFTSARWLWYLRRLSIEFFQDEGDPVDGSPHRRNLAETLAAVGGSTTPSPLRGPWYPINDAVVSRVIEFVAGVHYLAAVDWRVRAVARGVAMSISPHSELPDPRPTAAQAQAWEKHVKRLTHAGHHFGGRFLKRAGLPVGALSDDPDQPFCVLGAFEMDATMQTAKMRTESGQVDVRVLQRYSPACIDLVRLKDILSTSAARGPSDWPSREFCLVVQFLHFLLDAVHRRDELWISMLAYGFMSIDADMFDTYAPERFVALTEELYPLVAKDRLAPDLKSLMLELRGLPSSIVPLRTGAVLRYDGELLLVDIRAATGTLETRLDYPSVQGDQANWRSQQFELAIREMLAASAWAAPQRLASLEGRTLRVDGRALTDVDAIATDGSRLLLVSAKSRVFTAGDDSGDYASVRNASEAVGKACEEAQELMNVIQARPNGDNFDFSEYQQVLVVVCTPFPIYVPLGIATEEISAGVPRVMSFVELATFVNEPVTQTTK